MIRYFKSFFTATWQAAEEHSLEQRTFQGSRPGDFRIIIILLYIAFGLTVVRYFGNIDLILVQILTKNPGHFQTWFCCFFYGTDLGKFHQMIWWAGLIIVVYLIIPVIIVKFIFKDDLKNFGWSFRNVHKDYPLYILMLAIMLPIVFFASSTTSFQARYPLFQPSRESLVPLFLWWQLAYFIQFAAVEFFFRGFVLHGLKGRFGFYAIFISMIPYCMVHFGKPFGETIAAIPAGIILGTLSLKSRSVVLGILIHYSVAITMDIFALYREGMFQI